MTKTVRIPIAELDAMPRGCVWHGCSEHYQGDMPRGWVSLTTYWAPQPIMNFMDIPPQDVKRDAVLCPLHTAALETFLKALR